MHPAWQNRMIAAISEAEKSLPNRHLISLNYAQRSARTVKPHPEVSLYNFHVGQLEAVTLNYHLGKAIGHNETGGSRRDDVTYPMEGWKFTLTGGALFSHLDEWKLFRPVQQSRKQSRHENFLALPALSHVLGPAHSGIVMGFRRCRVHLCRLCLARELLARRDGRRTGP